VIHPDDHELARALASEAGAVLRSLRDVTPLDELKATGDAASHELLMRRLAELRPDDRVLSEESAAHTAGSGSGRVWIIDPLDGTREFGEEGRRDWAVHVALVIDDQLAAGAVALPAFGVTHSTASPPVLSATRPGQPPRFVLSRSRPHPVVLHAAELLGAELVPMGSAGAKAMAVVDGAAEVYAHAGGQYEWDSAAPAAVAIAAGLHVSGIDGSALQWNKPDPWQPHLLICRPELAEPVSSLVRAAVAGYEGS
jgi:3'(2'), 5'-bisphosphate nucleotidase